MADVVSDGVFGELRRGGARKYPWEQWQDGQCWKITKGTDFNCSLRAMRMAIGIRAKYVGMKFKTKTIATEESLVFQFLSGSE